MNSFSVYEADQVHQLLDFDGCFHAIRAAMERMTADGLAQPLRNILELAPGKLLGLMPGQLTEPQGFGAKLISVFHDLAHPGRSTHRGVVVLFDRDAGEIACIADAGAITEIRTAAASAVATDALARPDARRLAVLGCGAQAASHVRAIARVRPLDEIVIWGRSTERAQRLADSIAAELPVRIRASRDPQLAVKEADIICTVTASPTPILLGAWVKAGTHINLVGSSYVGPVEIDHALLLASRYIVDSRRSAIAAASEFLLAKSAGLINDEHIVAEIGEVLLNRVAGRTTQDEITIYKSLGHIVQDLAAAEYIHSRGKQEIGGHGAAQIPPI